MTNNTKIVIDSVRQNNGFWSIRLNGEDTYRKDYIRIRMKGNLAHFPIENHPKSDLYVHTKPTYAYVSVDQKVNISNFRKYMYYLETLGQDCHPYKISYYANLEMIKETEVPDTWCLDASPCIPFVPCCRSMNAAEWMNVGKDDEPDYDDEALVTERRENEMSKFIRLVQLSMVFFITVVLLLLLSQMTFSQS